ncbi:MAG: polygalacturonase [Lachnospiraceae bacterium]|nr:polygalacturonase [Lachnospiraceae bacterium]
MIIDITAQGAVGDGKKVNTAEIQAAIDMCHEAGGGTVLIPKGNYISGTVFLKSNVLLEIAAGGVLTASGDIRDYRENVHYNRYRNEKALDRCFIYAENQENIKITGKGEINGNAEAFPNEGSIYRPMMLRFLRCRNIHISEVKLHQSASWTAAFLDSSCIWVREVHIFNDKNYNGDGLDFDGCAHVFVDNCSITGTDDNLCLQAGSREYPVRDVHITNCEFSSLCAAIRIGLKSIGEIQGVVISNCTMERVWREGIKIECTEGGSITDIGVCNVVMRDVSRPLFIILNNRFETEDYGSSVELKQMPEIGRMENLMFSGIIAADSEEMKKTHFRFDDDIMGRPEFEGIRIDAERNHPIRGITMTNIRYHSVGGVKKEGIPECYPEVLDRRLYPGVKVSENYYPDWSRAAFMDVRNVEDLYLAGIQFSCEEPDERESYYIEGCYVLKQEIYLQKTNAKQPIM